MAVWRFWFEEGGPARWFRKDPAFDEAIRTRFGALPDAALAGDLDGWRTEPRSALARVLVLDQFPRNLYRGEARMFRYDAAALAAADQLLHDGLEATLGVDERCFVYLPYEHAEDLAHQDRAVALFTALGHPEYLKFAHAHRDIIVRFGRFPHRNAALGREGTPEEVAFLSQPGSSF